MIGATKRTFHLDKVTANDIVNSYRHAYYTDDMTLLVVSAWRAINFIETWIELNEKGQMDQATKVPIKRTPEEPNL